MRSLLLCSVVLLLAAGCGAAPEMTPSRTDALDGSHTLEGSGGSQYGALRFVALGDSYTIGAGLRPRERWPNQLVRAMRPGINLVLSANLARSSATSEDVIVEQLPQLRSLRPHVVSLLVGVNDVVAGVDPEAYRANVTTILDAITERLPARRVFILTTPDYTLTPRGGDYGDRAQQSAGIAAINAILAEEAATRGMHLIDISGVSDRVAVDPSLLATDGLHPSAKQYAGWVELIATRMRPALAEGGAPTASPDAPVASPPGP